MVKWRVGKMVKRDVDTGEAQVSLSATEVAALLGVSVQFVRRRASSGTMPAHRMSARFHFFEDELVEWLRSGAVSPHASGKEPPATESTVDAS